MKISKGWIFLLVAFSGLIIISFPAYSDEITQDAVITNTQEPIPAIYQNYALLLFPSTEWLSNSKKETTQSIFRSFKDFGDAIGERNAAIWFVDHSGKTDVSRSKEYCRKYNLSYNSGPYIVVMPKHPDKLTSKDEVVVIRISNISPDKVTPILNTLEEDLLISRRIRRRKLLYEEIKQRIFTVAQNMEVEFNFGVITVKPK